MELDRALGSLPDLNEATKAGRNENTVATLYFQGKIKSFHDCRNIVSGSRCTNHRSLTQARSAGRMSDIVQERRRPVSHHHLPFKETSFQGATCSPVSSHSARSSSTPHNQVQNPIILQPTAPEEPMSTTAGPSSVNRLIAVVRSTPSHVGPIYSRRLLCRNFAALCLGHAMITAAFIPLFALQGSISSWWWPPEPEDTSIITFQVNGDVGSLLLASLFTLGAFSSLGTPLLIHRIGTNWSLTLSYIATCVFFGVHLFPNVYIMVPGYLLMGIWLGPLVGARITYMMTLASKWAYVLSEEEEDEVEYLGGISRTELIVQRLSRGLQVAQDMGLMIGNFFASLLLWYTVTSIKDINDSNFILDAMFIPLGNIDRVCGRLYCPMTSTDVIGDLDLLLIGNNTDHFQKYVLPCKTTTMLASVFLGCCVMGVALTAVFMDHIKPHIFQDPDENFTLRAAFNQIWDVFKDPRLQLAAPLSIFIGLEQGFIYADFNKSYVVCALGIVNVPMIFLSLGILQSIAGFTLNMLLQHIHRYIVIVMGFLFHSCLLLVLLLWKPNADDPALLYVVAAAWGVCNAIWDTLHFSLIVSLFPEKWQAPIAHSFFFRYVGLASAFGLHGAICNWLKLYGLAGFMVFAITPYTWLELRLHAQRKLERQMETTNL